ncbi:MAG: ribonuclease J [Tissierellia bacterium]|nr:ribonuclease J [Tissierellia bacterium]
MSKQKGKSKRPAKHTLRVIPLGGLKEIGKNMTVFEYGNDIVIVDAGIMFPEEDLLGVDVVIPDLSYIENNAKKIRGIIFTHGHEDHIGAVPYLMDKISAPLYVTPFTKGLLNHKLKEAGKTKVNFQEKKAGDVFEIGPFTIEMIHVNHSIPDAVALFIKTPSAKVLMTGDFKVDFTPVGCPAIDLARFGALGNEGIDLLLSDSTNVERDGYTMSEATVGSTFDKLFRESQSRIFVASFASNVQRIQQVVNAARLNQRMVAFTGRSMNTITKIAMELGYLNIPKEDIIDIADINKYPDNEVTIMTTGSQGEPMAALTRMADNTHAQLQLKEGDMVILSSSPIPGNEKSVSNVINRLFEMGVKVIYQELYDVHVSGHARREELKLMLALTKPKYFMPVHGEYSMLKHHSDLAVDMGMSPDNVILSENGDVIELRDGQIKLGQKVQAGRILIDGAIVGDVGTAVLRDRKQLSEDGLLMVLLTLDSDNGKLIREPDIISRGFIYMKESTGLIDEAKAMITKELNSMPRATRSDWSQIKNTTRKDLSRFFFNKTKRRPMILVFILEV